MRASSYENSTTADQEAACRRSVTFFFPVHNEEVILEESIRTFLQYCQTQVYRFDWQIMIVVNGSTDQTQAIAETLSRNYPERIQVHSYAEAGRGQALKKAWAASQADFFLYMDIDLSVSLSNINDLLNPLLNGDCDLAVGSRLLADSRIERSFLRELVSQSYNFLSRLILNHHFSDMQCGFKALNRIVFARISPHLRNQGWFFDTELIIWTKCLGFKVKEIPVNWYENRFVQRKSKVHLFRDSCRFLVNLFRLKFKTARRSHPHSGVGDA